MCLCTFAVAYQQSRFLAESCKVVQHISRSNLIEQTAQANMSTASGNSPRVYGNSNVDPRTRVRTVPMEVLSLGYSRTGTMSMYMYSLS
jgi:hypothetical protein